MESMRDAQGHFLEQLMGNKIHLAHETSSMSIVAGIAGGKFSTRRH
jgi:hypothetical protein